MTKTVQKKFYRQFLDCRLLQTLSVCVRVCLYVCVYVCECVWVGAPVCLFYFEGLYLAYYGSDFDQIW